ncbi:cytochrome P450 [Sphingopyxis yananensis]|uniref:cytochrome P450 n=1 Tax=Sphingopyxis yananensis TaxID=2886687 RepID=UPI001D0FA2F3|nr:cytochrome P450 [Sphingopyxis yananensis]MCC2602080.1 cytochrome P450 [Sphingopyxis yananensis]
MSAPVQGNVAVNAGSWPADRFGPDTAHWLPRGSGRNLDHIPGEDGLPVLGNTLAFLRDYRGFSRKMVARYGPVYRSTGFGGRSVALMGADANELVMFDRDKLFSSEQGWGPLLNLLFPRGLMLMDFDHHRADRKTLSVAFKPEPMRYYAVALNEGIKQRVAEWSGKQFAFYPAIKALTLDLAATAFLGIPWGPEADKINKAFVDMVQASVGIVRRPLPFTAMGRGVAGRKYLVDYFTQQVPERRAKGGQDIFSQFCAAKDDNGEYLSDSSIVDHMIFLMMAAHDTITSSLSTMMWQLARNPEWQDRLREEMLSVSPAGEGVGHNGLNELELTEWAFKESLRLVPPVPSFPRRALRDFEFGGYTIPAGTSVGISPAYTHMMEEYWPNPDEFDPMRFSPEQVRRRHKYAWVPFGGGAHMCLGLHFAYMQAKIFLHHVLTQNRIEMEAGYEPEWALLPIPRPKDGLRLRFVPLKS